LADDCLAISAIAGKRHLRSARRGVTTRTKDNDGDAENAGVEIAGVRKVWKAKI